MEEQKECQSSFWTRGKRKVHGAPRGEIFFEPVLFAKDFQNLFPIWVTLKSPQHHAQHLHP